MRDYRFEEIDQVSKFQRIEGVKKQKLDDILFRSSFNIKQNFAKDKDREKLEKEFRNCHKDHHKYFEEQKTQTNSSLRSQEYSISKLKKSLDLFESYWLAGTNSKTTQDFLMACEFLIERIGIQGNHLAKSNKFPETDYLSLSKYQLLLLSAARKALAHHPLEINSNKITYLVEKLGAEARIQIQDSVFHQKDLNHSLEEYQEVTADLLDKNESQIINLVLEHGFRDQFFCYSLNFGCDIGVQQDLNLVVEPLIPSRSKYSDFFSLELRLCKLLRIKVQIFNFSEFLTIDSKKIAPSHIEELKNIEEFKSFLSSEQFRKIYKLSNWSAVTINGTEYQKGANITESEFMKASGVDYIYEQRIFDKEKEALAIFRKNRLNSNEKIKKIIEEKALGYLRNLTDGIKKLKNSLSEEEYCFLREFFIADKDLDLEIESIFYSNRSKLLENGFKNGLINFRDSLKDMILGNLKLLDIISDNANFLNLASIWKEKFGKLPEKLQENILKLRLFFFEIRSRDVIEKLFLQQDNTEEIKKLILNELEISYAQDNGNKCIGLLKIFFYKSRFFFRSRI